MKLRRFNENVIETIRSINWSKKKNKDMKLKRFEAYKIHDENDR